MSRSLLYGFDVDAWARMIQWWIRSQPGVALPANCMDIITHWCLTRGDDPKDSAIALDHLSPWRRQKLEPSQFCRREARKLFTANMSIHFPKPTGVFRAA